MTTRTQYSGNEVAVIGMACRLPGASTIEAFWRLLCEGREALTSLSKEELRASGVDESLLANPHYVRATPLLSEVESFDYELFGFTRREAEITDVQHRIFLECAWEALERAGYNPRGAPGSVGVFAGTFTSTYWLHLLRQPGMLERFGEMALRHSNEKDYLATRTSYKLNLRGPSLTVQTSCSTSLVAVHIACQSLLLGECDMALAGGVSVQFPHRTGYLHEPGGLLSPDGHCRPFDRGAQGTIFGQGAALILMKRLERAIADRDVIHAVVRGSAINNDGANRMAFTAPTPEGQARVILDALATAGVSAADVGFVEAHGTGTTLGDPIEVRALTDAFRTYTDRRGYCHLGAVKSNVGHLGAAAGATGFIKAVLAVEHGLIPPLVNFNSPNPELHLEETPFIVERELRRWDSERPRIAGVSSFGMGGTNAHAVLQEYRSPAQAASPRRQHPAEDPAHELVLLSARTGDALAQLERGLAEALRDKTAEEWAAALATLRHGRESMVERLAVLARDPHEAARALSNEAPALRERGSVRQGGVAWLLAADPARAAGFSQRLFEREVSYRAAIEQCAEAVRRGFGADLMSVLQAPARDDGEPDDAPLHLLEAAAFAAAFGLAKAVEHHGVRADAYIGRNLAEFVAACLAGTFTLDGAIGALAGAWERVRPSPPQRRFLSTATGVWITPEQATSREYWLALRDRPGAAALTPDVATMDGFSTVVDLRGPSEARAKPSQAFGPEALVPVLLGAGPEDDDALTLTRAVARLWVRGAADPAGGAPSASHSKLLLPTYPFQRVRCIIDAAAPSASAPPRKPEATPGAQATGAPQVESEEQALATVVAIFRDLFGAPDVAAETSFLELGGNSLVAVQLIARMRAALRVEIALREVFAAPTPGDLARLAWQRFLGGARAEGGDREQFIAELAEQMQGLSAEEVAALAAEARAPAPETTATSRASEVPPPVLSRRLALGIAFPSGARARDWDLLLRGARMADENGLAAAWILGVGSAQASASPWLHGAALAAHTRRLSLRIGSASAPPQDSARWTAEWSAVHELSAGRAEMVVAEDSKVRSGLRDGDRARFELAAQAEAIRRVLRHDLEALARGGSFAPDGRVPLWFAAHREGWEEAARCGASVIASLLNGSVEEIAEHAKRYRSRLAEYGHNPASTSVALLAPAYLDSDDARARRMAHASLQVYAGAPELAKAYLQRGALVGDVVRLQETLARMSEAGIDEIACLIDFGIEPEMVLQSLERLASAVTSRAA